MQKLFTMCLRNGFITNCYFDFEWKLSAVIREEQRWRKGFTGEIKNVTILQQKKTFKTVTVIANNPKATLRSIEQLYEKKPHKKFETSITFDSIRIKIHTYIYVSYLKCPLHIQNQKNWFSQEPVLFKFISFSFFFRTVQCIMDMKS